jgi:hypothetical protein
MRNALLVMAVCALGSAFGTPENAFLGTWKLNNSKSKFDPGPSPKEKTITFERKGERIRRTSMGMDGCGKPITRDGLDDVSIRWDGEYHEVTRSHQRPLVVAVNQVNARTMYVRTKRDQKIINRVYATISKDGKTLTMKEKGINSRGQKTNNVEVFYRR